MTTVTESDIQEIKNLIFALEQKLMFEIIELKAEVKNINTKVEATNVKIEATNVKIEATNTKLEINNAKIEATNVKIEALDKRLTDGLNNLDKRILNQEFIYRAVVIGVIGLLLTPLATNAIRYFWENPFFPVR